MEMQLGILQKILIMMDHLMHSTVLGPRGQRELQELQELQVQPVHRVQWDY